jgi:hypothetical protein
LPTVLLVDGFRFYFFSDEGDEPPQVHVRKGDGIGKVWLRSLSFAYAEGLNASEVRRIRELAFANRVTFLARWNEHFPR